MIPDDVTINKAAIIRRCLARVREEHGGRQESLENLTRQDSIVLNLQRACEAAIDLAMHRVARRSLGVPQASRDAFVILEKAGALTPDTAKRMRAMVGFRNIAVHNYQELQVPVLQRIIEAHLGDFETFIAEITRSAA